MTEGTVSRSNDAEIVVAFGERADSRADRAVTSGFCQLHWGLLSLGSDGTALWKSELSSLTASDRWQGRFELRDKEATLIGTVPRAGTFDVDVREVRPRRLEMIIPLYFERDLFKNIHSVRMLMECRPKET
jgi:hypothetical protein